MMKLNQLKTIHAWIRTTQTSEILFVSSLILPFYLLLYNYAIIQINNNWRDGGLILAFLLYVVGIVWMKRSQSQDEKKQKDLLVLKNYILDKGFKFMSFEKILEIDNKFTDDRIRELIFLYPNELRLAKLKDNKRGIKILNIEEE